MESYLTAHCFSPFGNVSDDDKSTLGTSADCMWKPWLYEERLKTAAKVETKRREVEETNLAASTKRKKLLNYIRDLKSRQEYPPILGPLIDNIYAEPLHNGNNAWQQLHAHILSHTNGKSSMNGLFQKKSTPPRQMGLWKFSREGGSKTLEIQGRGV